MHRYANFPQITSVIIRRESSERMGENGRRERREEARAEKLTDRGERRVRERTVPAGGMDKEMRMQ